MTHSVLPPSTRKSGLRRQADSASRSCTQVIPAGKFWEAEEYHQKYFSRRGIAATCNL